MKKYLKQIIFGVILLAGVYFIIKNRDQFAALLTIRIEILLPLFLVSLLAFIPLTLEFKYFMNLFQIKLKFKEWFGLSAVNTMYNYFVPARGGLVARAYYLKKKYNFDYTKYVSLLGGSFLLAFLIASFMSTSLILVQFFIKGVLYKNIFYISLALFAFTLILGLIIWFMPELRLKTRYPKINKIVNEIIQGVAFLNTNIKLLFFAALSQLGLILFMGLRLYLSFRAIDIEVDLIDILIVQSLVVFSMVISITPGNLGIKEGIIGLLASMVGIPMKDALMAATIDRAMAMIVVFIFGIIYHFVLMKIELNKNS